MTSIWGSIILNTLVAGLVLLRPRRACADQPRRHPTVDIRRVAYSAFAALLAIAVELPLLRNAGMSRFGLMNLAFLSLFVMLPAIGLSTLVAAVVGRRPNPGPYVTKGVCLLGAAALLLVPIGVYASFIEPYDLRIETADLRVLPGRVGSEPVRIGVMADIQTGRITEYERSAVATLMSQQPDIILLPGDFYQGPAAQFEAMLPAYRDLLAGLHAPGGVYAVLGNIDERETLDRLFEGTSVRLLLDELVRIRVRDRVVTLCGIFCDRYLTPDSLRALRDCESLSGEGDIRLLLSHSPDSALALSPASRIDLVVAGHTHGGQVVLPLLGPPITFSNVPRAVSAGGLHQLNGHAIYVSRGVGCEGGQAPRIRFLSPPDVSIINLIK